MSIPKGNGRPFSHRQIQLLLTEDANKTFEELVDMLRSYLSPDHMPAEVLVYMALISGAGGGPADMLVSIMVEKAMREADLSIATQLGEILLGKRTKDN